MSPLPELPELAYRDYWVGDVNTPEQSNTV